MPCWIMNPARADCSGPLMVVYNLNIVGIAISPHKADAPLIVDPNNAADDTAEQLDVVKLRRTGQLVTLALRWLVEVGGG